MSELFFPSGYEPDVDTSGPNVGFRTARLNGRMVPYIKKTIVDDFRVEFDRNGVRQSREFETRSAAMDFANRQLRKIQRSTGQVEPDDPPGDQDSEVDETVPSTPGFEPRKGPDIVRPPPGVGNGGSGGSGAGPTNMDTDARGPLVVVVVVGVLLWILSEVLG